MEVLQPAAAVGAVLLLLAAAMWGMKRMGWAARLPARKAGGRRLECLERMALSPQHTLHLVRMGDAALLVSSGPGGCTLLRAEPYRDLETGGPAR
jgi:flagellar biosynthetic protein FliO